MPSPTRHRRRHEPSTTPVRSGKSVVMVFVGGLLGSCLREAVSWIFPDSSFPFAILAVNSVGAFALGWLVSRRERSAGWGASIPFGAIGVLGSFTTFSAFCVATLDLLGTGRFVDVVVFVLGSVVGGLVLASWGVRLGGSR